MKDFKIKEVKMKSSVKQMSGEVKQSNNKVEILESKKESSKEK